MQAAILWVEDYESMDLSLPYSKESARGFASGLGIAEADVFEQKDSEVRERLFKRQGSGQPAPVDVAPILYYSGHGTDAGPQFNDGKVATSKEVFLGKAVAVAAFDCCSMMDHFEGWKAAFGGLRYLLGFTTTIKQSDLRGPCFATRLRVDKLPFPEAWRRAATETGSGAWRSLRAYLGDKQPPDEGWPPEGPLVNDAGLPLRFACRTEDPSPPLRALGRDALTDQDIRLFRTPKPDADEVSLHAIGSRFRMDGHALIEHFKARQIRAQDSSLEVFEESNSLWWVKRTDDWPASPPGMIPTARLLEYAPLVENLGMQCQLSQPWETFTTEINDTPDGSCYQEIQVARHLEFPFTLNGMPVFGPGARLRLTVQRDDLTELLLFSRRPVEDRIVPIISWQEALQRLLSDPAVEKVKDFVRILRWCLGYYARAPRMPQDCLLPVYAIEAFISKPAVRRRRFVCYVQAVRQEVREGDFPEHSVLRSMPPVFP